MKREGGRYVVDPKTGKTKLVHRTMPAPVPAPETPVKTSTAAPASPPVSAGAKQKKDD